MDINDNDPGRSYHIKGRMLVATIISLSFIILLVTLVYIYVRCIIRRQERRRITLGQLGLVHEPPKTGLDQTSIQLMPTFVFKLDYKAPTKECAVCLSNLEDGEIIRVLPNCEHNFHVACIDTWLSTNLSCPVCRTVAEPQKEPQKVVHELGAAEGSGNVHGLSPTRLASFRKMLTRNHSSQRIHTGLEES